MKSFKKILAILLVATSIFTKNYVTYGNVGGRTGDFLIAYMHALWVSYKYNIEFLYKPFEYSNKMTLHNSDKLYNDEHKNMFHKILTPETTLDQFINLNEDNIVYVIPYFPESFEEHLSINCPFSLYKKPVFPYFKIDWKDARFKKMISDRIKPIDHMNLIYPPKNRISIAVHIRKNSNGFDLPLLNDLENEQDFDPNQLYVDVALPLKHPPETYYIQQLENITHIYKNNKLYVFIFTDDEHPETISNKIQSRIIHRDIVFDYRKDINNHYSNVLEDLFSITNFDCFIRPDSNLGIAASKIGNFKLLISPKHHTWIGKKMVIDKILIEETQYEII